MELSIVFDFLMLEEDNEFELRLFELLLPMVCIEE
jgi:hypothetical protein